MKSVCIRDIQPYMLSSYMLYFFLQLERPANLTSLPMWPDADGTFKLALVLMCSLNNAAIPAYKHQEKHRLIYVRLRRIL